MTTLIAIPTPADSPPRPATDETKHLDKATEEWVDHCDCGAEKLAAHRTCKKCAVDAGRYSIEVGAFEIPCPLCGDGRDPKFSLCTSCSVVKGYLKIDGTRNTDCPKDQCPCGRMKRAVFSACTHCWESNKPAANGIAVALHHAERNGRAA